MQAPMSGAKNDRPMSAEPELGQESAESLDAFIAEVQTRALTMARLNTRSTDEALDLVQEAMFAFVRNYADKPRLERKPLFFRCLNNRIIDWQRKKARRGRWLVFGSGHSDAPGDGPDVAGADTAARQPDRMLDQDRFGCAVESALETLPLRQRQVFLLRAWEGLDVRETAAALGISGGSVKTHYFRALGAMRQALEKFND